MFSSWQTLKYDFLIFNIKKILLPWRCFHSSLGFNVAANNSDNTFLYFNLIYLHLFCALISTSNWVKDRVTDKKKSAVVLRKKYHLTWHGNSNSFYVLQNNSDVALGSGINIIDPNDEWWGNLLLQSICFVFKSGFNIKAPLRKIYPSGSFFDLSFVSMTNH